MGKYIIILFVIIVSVLPAKAQETTNDTIHVEDVKVQSPKKASIYSAILPGLGQAYNKKYWKIPIIYVGFGAFVYFIDWNNGWYNLYKNAYIDLLVDEGFDSEAFIEKYSKIPQLAYVDYENSSDKQYIGQRLTKAYESHRRNRDLLIICTGLFYAMNIIDASVDAHLYDFDISDNLSFNWRPSVINIENQRYVSINCSFNF